MQLEDTKLTFIMNFSVLDYSNMPPEYMPQIAQILVFQNFTRGMPLDPIEISSFFSLSIPASVLFIVAVLYDISYNRSFFFHFQSIHG